MSDTSPTIGEVVDQTTNSVAENAATQAAANVAGSVPDTTVVVEDNPTVTDPADALSYAEDVKRIARETTDQAILEWAALAEANAPKQPDVVVVHQEPEPAPVVQPEPAQPEAPAEDESPPKAHPYYRPLGKRGKR